MLSFHTSILLFLFALSIYDTHTHSVTFEINDYPSPDCGLGVTFNHVAWQMLQHPGEKYWVNIDKRTSPYLDQSRGGNPWDYYFVQDAPDGPTAKLREPTSLALSGHNNWTLRHQQTLGYKVAHNFKLHAELAAEIESFRSQFFRGRVLGVYLRGTDKISEYRAMPDGEIIAEVSSLIQLLKPDTIFLATDDARYHGLMQRFSPVSMTIPRSHLSQHHHSPNGAYLSGRWAIMDAWLLAACNWLIFTPSNFATIPLLMGRHESIHRINRHCVITPFIPQVEAIAQP